MPPSRLRRWSCHSKSLPDVRLKKVMFERVVRGQAEQMKDTPDQLARTLNPFNADGVCFGLVPRRHQLRQPCHTIDLDTVKNGRNQLISLITRRLSEKRREVSPLLSTMTKLINFDSSVLTLCHSSAHCLHSRLNSDNKSGLMTTVPNCLTKYNHQVRMSGKASSDDSISAYSRHLLACFDLFGHTHTNGILPTTGDAAPIP
jgi:hypothetical protein